MRHAPALLFISLFLVSCSGEEAEAKRGREAGEAMVKEITERAFRDVAVQRAKKAKALEEGPVRIPSHRRLRAFMPETLPGASGVSRLSEERPNQGVAEAQGHYNFSDGDQAKSYRFELNYFGKEAFNQGKRKFDYSNGELTEIAGLKAQVETVEFLGRTNCTLWIEFSPEMFLSATGGAGREDLEQAVQQLDLAEIARFANSDQLFELNEFDRAAAKVLSKKELKDLLPESFGGLKQGSGSASEDLGASPAMAQAYKHYGSYQVRLTDYGDAAMATRIELDPMQLGNLTQIVEQTGLVPTIVDVDMQGGQGRMVEIEHGGAVWVGMHLVRDRMVLAFFGPFQEVRELSDDLPDHVQQMLAEMEAQVGKQEWKSLAEQQAGVIDFFEGLQLPAQQ